MNATTIQKYSKKSIPQLVKLATKHFNSYIRNRDREMEFYTCIACGETKRIFGNDYQASHFYSAGNYLALRFNEDNVHGGCKKCNYFLSGNLIEYRHNLVKKIGESGVKDLDNKAALNKRQIFKWDRFFLIEIIEEYKNK